MKKPVWIWVWSSGGAWFHHSFFHSNRNLMFLSKGSRDENFGKNQDELHRHTHSAKYGFRALGLDKVYVMGGTFANVRVGWRRLGKWRWHYLWTGRWYEKNSEGGMGWVQERRNSFKTGVAMDFMRTHWGSQIFIRWCEYYDSLQIIRGNSHLQVRFGWPDVQVEEE